ncbi:cysteine-rich CWC family protein [Piscinibacter sp. HJYY11]|uniref:cysteine-rich CWC family protein n=1 Tax=Piscinibacter sp. HJYY11 TaxID=2801333 RepID=UPI00191F6B63|nr:cysteine-rich CWC family protein [Piscinibacter sp. HJYY11]MBL0728300.1 cysteine-rich CWC family protein [Piscinibacter sp. HJYY11]
MSSTADASCPRCGGGFHCGVRDTTPCACGTIDLSAETLQLLREHYSACLCLPCLREVARLSPDALRADMTKPAPS